MDMSDTIAVFLSGSYTVTRKSASSYGTDGRLASPSTTTFAIPASVQPTKGRDLQRLPEGLRTMEIITIYTATELKTQGPSQDPDSIAVGDASYEIQTVERWAELGNYFKCLALKIGH